MTTGVALQYSRSAGRQPRLVLDPVMVAATFCLLLAGLVMVASASVNVAERQSGHLEDAQPTSVLVFGEEAVREVESRFMATYADRARFSLNRPVGLPHYVVLTHPEAEKASGLELVCRELGVEPQEAIAMGDSESDLGMLRFAGLGIAMANSPDEVKRSALHIAPTNDQDGVAWAVRKFLL